MEGEVYLRETQQLWQYNLSKAASAHPLVGNYANLDEAIASSYQPSQDQTHKACSDTWSIQPWT